MGNDHFEWIYLISITSFQEDNLMNLILKKWDLLVLSCFYLYKGKSFY